MKELRAHSGTELGTWIGWANQLTHIFDPHTLLFPNDKFYVNVKCTSTMCVVLE